MDLNSNFWSSVMLVVNPRKHVCLKKIVIIFVNLCMLRIYELLFYGQIMHVLGPEDEQKNKKLGAACPPDLSIG